MSPIAPRATQCDMAGRDFPETPSMVKRRRNFGRWGRKKMQGPDAEAAVKVDFDNFEHGFPEGFGPGGWGWLGYATGIAFAVFQLVVAAWNVLPSQVVRGVHVGFLILMTFGLVANFTAKSNAGRTAGWLIGAVGFLCGLYQWVFYADLIARDGDPTHLDLAVGSLLAVLIFEGTRRLMGLALPLMCGACILYWFLGQYLPAPFNHRGYDFDQIVTHLSFGTEGFYGCRFTFPRPTSFCSFCSAPSWSAPG